MATLPSETLLCKWNAPKTKQIWLPISRLVLCFTILRLSPYQQINVLCTYSVHTYVRTCLCSCHLCFCLSFFLLSSHQHYVNFNVMFMFVYRWIFFHSLLSIEKYEEQCKYEIFCFALHSCFLSVIVYCLLSLSFYFFFATVTNCSIFL